MDEGKYLIEVSKESVGFCASHFLVFKSGRRERIHGHNFKVRAGITSSKTDCGMVMDFLELSKELKDVVAPLDYKMLLAGDHDSLEIQNLGKEVIVKTQDGERFIFPEDDVCILPIEETTAECLARYIAEKLHKKLSGVLAMDRFCVSVEEMEGHSASYMLGE
ncbi:MAG: 6-pyruvoyl tetrahydropterin synthase family protein [Bacteriovoracaceae bacterium]|nr:6-pyruvoyl tetrahydropterin synthase family protein [Bacteriovoracaceae bacterium]